GDVLPHGHQHGRGAVDVDGHRPIEPAPAAPGTRGAPRRASVRSGPAGRSRRRRLGGPVPTLHHVNLGVSPGQLADEASFLLDVLGYRRMDLTDELRAMGAN